MKIEVKIEKKHLVALAILGVLLLAGIFAYAYGTSSPQVFGHSAGEVDVEINGNTMTLQDAITNNLIGGDGNANLDLKLGPPGCNNIITNADTCKTIPVWAVGCTGSGCVAQSIYLNCDGTNGPAGGGPNICPTFPYPQ